MNDAWITTSERIPYEPFRVGMPPDITAQQLRQRLDECAVHITDSYRSKAYSLADGNDVVFCIKPNWECAILVFHRKAMQIDDIDSSRDPIWESAKKGLARLNALLGRDNGQMPLFKIVSMEPTEISQISR